MDTEEKPTRRVGRPRKFAEGSTSSITVSIEKRQREWLDAIAKSSPDESASRIVREALDLWHQVHVEPKGVDAFGQKQYYLNQSEQSRTGYAVTSLDDNDPWQYEWL